MMIAVVLFLAAILTIMTFLAAFAILTAVHFAFSLLAAILSVMTFLAAFTILAAVHFTICFLAAVLSVMTFFAAFTILAAIHGFNSCSRFPVVLAAAMQFIVCLVSCFESRVIITHLGDLLLYFGCVGGTALVKNREYFCVHIPAGILDAGFFGGLFDLGLAHTAVTGDLKGLGLCLGYCRRRNAKHSNGNG